MDRLSRERDEDVVPDVRRPEPPAPEPVQAGSMAWASAVGNQAVQRLARQELEPAEAEAEAEAEPEEEPTPPEVMAMQDAGIGMDAVAGLEAVDELGEDALPE